VLAAHRAGLRRVLLPDRNRKDLVDIPQEIQDDMEMLFVNNITEATELALLEADNASARKPVQSPETARPAM
jgi:ATP-dependent Lon protease